METLMSRITGKMKLDTLIALILGVFFLLVLLVISSINRDPSSAAERIWLTVLALAAASWGAAFSGFLIVKLELDLSGGTRLFIEAAGALAVFVIVFFFPQPRIHQMNPSQPSRQQQAPPQPRQPPRYPLAQRRRVKR